MDNFTFMFSTTNVVAAAGTFEVFYSKFNLNGTCTSEIYAQK